MPYSLAVKNKTKWFVDTYGDGIAKAIKGTNLYFPTVVAQKALESGWGESSLAKYDFNFGGIKCAPERFSTLLTGAQLNKAIIGYNAGAYTKSINTQGKPNKVPIDTTTLVKMPTVPKETKGYLVKMLGVDGFVSLIYKDNAI